MPTREEIEKIEKWKSNTSSANKRPEGSKASSRRSDAPSKASSKPSSKAASSEAPSKSSKASSKTTFVRSMQL